MKYIKKVNVLVISGLMLVLNITMKAQPSGKEILERIDRNMSAGP